MSRAEPGKSTPRKSTPVLAVDTGGTFTDLLLLSGGALTALKVLSDPSDPAGPVLRGLRQILGGTLPAELLLVHGSTVATNAILERKGARVVLVTNEGFEDVIEIARQDRPQLYALTGHRPPPLVSLTDRVGIRGRLTASGEELLPLDSAQVRALPGLLREAEAVAITLLHSYANPDHEEAVAHALRDMKVPISISSRVLPEFREFERTSTTVANAYVAPRIAGYLARIQEELGQRRVRVMGSNGGALSLSRAIEEPIHTVLSGPAGGVVGALEWGRRAGYQDLLSFDMGGTSTDVSLISGAALQHTREGKVGDVPVAIAALDIHTVGAGGGSIARIDPGGALLVGPESAGAHPGPVAYGLGGREVTVTDAHVWLGRLPESALLGGEMRLDRAGIRGPMEELADRARMPSERLAEGIIEVANAAMERALRVISVERGVDPAGFHLVAFGGAAGLHAAELTERLGLAGAIVPPNPGLLSAFGMLVAPVVRDRSRTAFLSSADAQTDERIRSVLDELEHAARGEMLAEGAAEEGVVVTRWIDARYRDQSFELLVPADDWIAGFHAAHEKRFGYRRTGVALEAVTLRVRAESRGLEVQVASVADGAGQSPGPGHRPETRPVIWRGSSVDALVLNRSQLLPGSAVVGPAIVVEYSATTWCPPGWSIERDALDVLRLTAAGS